MQAPIVGTTMFERAYGLTIQKDFYKVIEITSKPSNIVLYISADPDKHLIIDGESALAIANLWYKKSWTDFDQYVSMVLNSRVVILDTTNPANFKGVVIYLLSHDFIPPIFLSSYLLNDNK